MASNYFSIHSHSEFSVLDGMGTVESMVAKAASLGQSGLALTDHGTMAGVLRLYKECTKAGIAPFPGSELYVVTDVNDPTAKTERFHMGMVALNYEGFQAMTKLSSRSFLRDRFHRKPLVDLGDFAAMSEAGLTKHVAVTTGCFFGIVVQALVNVGPAQARMVTEMLAGWFPNLYVELQHHGIYSNGHDDDDIADEMIALADDMGLPMVLGQDSHYCDAKEQHVHDLMKDICYFGDGEDNRFPGGPYHLAGADELRRTWAPRIWDRIEEGHSALLDMNTMKMPALDKYKFHVPSVAKKPNQVLSDKCIDNLIELEETAGLYADNEVYDDRLAYELDVIEKMGMADYFLLVQEVTDWCRDNGVIVNARGSANGSLVCYLLGITNVDPIQWSTSFDRFLSLDRKKPPDVDLDIESRSRDRVIEHLRKKFPTLVGIGTYSRLGITQEEDEFGGEDKGSVFVQYMAAMRKKPGFTGEVAPEHRRPLKMLADGHVRKSLGAHAGGYVLPTRDHPIDAYLATALIPSSNTVVTQAVMEDVEDCGYVKLDLLGLRSLETVNGALVNIGAEPNDWSWLPWDDKAACKMLSSGHTDGIFQFEGFATSKGGREMKIKNTLDSILCMALYRPALMAGGQKDMYLGNRGLKPADRPYALHPFFDKWLNDTSGVPVFQEQIMDMCRGVGLPYEEWNDLLKAVKASNDKIGQYAEGIMERVRGVFLTCCAENDIDNEDGEAAWEAITGFTDYGFNRAHATSYGIMAYRSAYLKTHHPLEYMQSLLTAWAGTKKEQLYMNECRRMGISIGRPNINTSGVSWAIDHKRPMTLRKGFVTIKGVGVNAAQAIVDHRPPGGWPDMDSFVASVPARPVSGGKEWQRTGMCNGVMERLQNAGALSVLGVDP